MKPEITTRPAKPYGIDVLRDGKMIGWVWEEDGSWCAEEFVNGMSWDTLGGTKQEAINLVVENAR